MYLFEVTRYYFKSDDRKEEEVITRSLNIAHSWDKNKNRKGGGIEYYIKILR